MHLESWVWIRWLMILIQDDSGQDFCSDHGRWNWLIHGDGGCLKNQVDDGREKVLSALLKFVSQRN